MKKFVLFSGEKTSKIVSTPKNKVNYCFSTHFNTETFWDLTCVRPVVSHASAPDGPNLGKFSLWRRIVEDWGNVELIRMAQILARPNFYNMLKVPIFKRQKWARYEQKHKSRFPFLKKKEHFFSYFKKCLKNEKLVLKSVLLKVNKTSIIVVI